MVVLDNATLHANFCLRVGEHERLTTTAEFRRHAMIPFMFLESFDCRSDPIDRVQPRSRTACVGWLARFDGVATASGVQESSVQ